MKYYEIYEYCEPGTRYEIPKMIIGSEEAAKDFCTRHSGFYYTTVEAEEKNYMNLDESDKKIRSFIIELLRKDNIAVNFKVESSINFNCYKIEINCYERFDIGCLPPDNKEKSDD